MERERIAVKAVVEAMFMRDKRRVIVVVRRSARSGILWLGETCWWGHEVREDFEGRYRRLIEWGGYLPLRRMKRMEGRYHERRPR